MVESISDDSEGRNEIFEKEIHAKEVSNDRDKPLVFAMNDLFYALAPKTGPQPPCDPKRRRCPTRGLVADAGTTTTHSSRPAKRVQLTRST